ncbi:MAG: hypothetical protein JW950_03830 [Deltaproteobacteria bacterium]|nr:hypothetical protein [Deltaproteobacteria bacterium]
MSRRIFVVVVMIGLLFLPAGFGLCEEKGATPEGAQMIEQIGQGRINWSIGYIEAKGIGAPPDRLVGKPGARPAAIRAAEIIAKRNLLEIIKGVRIDSTTVVRDFTIESDVINSQVEGFVKGAVIVGEPDYMSDGTVEVVVRMPLLGDLSRVIIPKVLERKPEVVAPPAPVAAPPVPAAPEPVAPAPAVPAPEVYTGLVVDARGIQARPAMSPRILDEDGEEVYGALNVDREYAVQQGMSGYARDLTAAQSNPRVTNNPISVKGLKTAGPGRSDIVIAMTDADRIRAASDNLTFMKKCRVMIVLD